MCSVESVQWKNNLLATSCNISLSSVAFYANSTVQCNFVICFYPPKKAQKTHNLPTSALDEMGNVFILRNRIVKRDKILAVPLVGTLHDKWHH